MIACRSIKKLWRGAGAAIDDSHAKEPMGLAASVISELEEALQGGSSEKRSETLRRVTDLFLSDAGRLSEIQVGVFDDVLGALIQSIEARALEQLSARLAPIDNAPRQVVRTLARSDEIAVAGPVLTHSKRLHANDLVNIAKTKSQAHLFAISGRSQIQEEVTDVLVERGNRDVVHRLANNGGAAFSDGGFTALTRRAETDETLTELLGRRVDLPSPLLRQLLMQATDAARARLLASAPAERRLELRFALNKVSGEIDRQTGIQRNREESERLVRDMHAKGRLDEAAVAKLARTNHFDEVMLATATLAGVSGELIDRLLLSERADALLVPFKAAGLSWTAVQEILQMRSFRSALGGQDFEQLHSDYTKLSRQTSQRVLRFWQVRNSPSSQGAAPIQPAPA